MHRRPRIRAAAALAFAGAVLVACGSGQDPTLPESAATTSTRPETTSTTTTAPPTTTTAPPDTTPTLPPPSAGTCPAAPAQAQPDPERPVHELAATVDVPGGIVDGTLRTRFAPDLPTDVMVFRLWPNGPRPAGHVTVGQVLDATTGAPLAAGQPDPTTLEIAVPHLEPGDTITVQVPFHLELTGSASDRISHSGDTLRLGSFVPMLAWEPGVGWAREPATAAFAEAATAPTADWTVRLDVTPGYDVLASGRRQPDGTWRAPAHRDFAASIGHFAFAQATEQLAGAASPVDVTVGVDTAVGEDPNRYLGRVLESLRDFTTRFGPYPWDTFTLAITPGLEGGIEFPSHVMQGPDTVGRTTPHEVGHMWFYGLVGGNQGRDPWLDEGLASYAEFRHEGAIDSARARDIPADAEGRAASPMTYWEAHQRSYYRGVYVQGANAVASLGDGVAGGLDLVDCALRLYVAVGAHAIATPDDLETALAVVFPDARARMSPYTGR